MTDKLVTPRLDLAPFGEDDSAAACAWFRDVEVMRYTPSGADPSVEATAKRIGHYRAHQTKHGFSKWIIRERASGTVVGDAGLLVLDEGGNGAAVIDLGYRLARPHWGRGYATEAAEAWVEAAFGHFGIERVMACVHPSNGASLRVARKLALRAMGPGRLQGMEAEIFSLDRGDFLARRRDPGR